MARNQLCYNYYNTENLFSTVIDFMVNLNHTAKRPVEIKISDSCFCVKVYHGCTHIDPRFLMKQIFPKIDNFDPIEINCNKISIDILYHTINSGYDWVSSDEYNHRKESMIKPKETFKSCSNDEFVVVKFFLSKTYRAEDLYELAAFLVEDFQKKTSCKIMLIHK